MPQCVHECIVRMSQSGTLPGMHIGFENLKVVFTRRRMSRRDLGSVQESQNIRVTWMSDGYALSL